MKYRVLWPLVGPFAFPESAKFRPISPLYQNDEFDFGTPEELTRMLAEGMIEPVGPAASGDSV
jgi:hypothetical protein